MAQIMTNGILAFVSYVRAYANHQCSYIFRLANIDYVGLAFARGLLTLPKVPEIKYVGFPAQISFFIVQTLLGQKLFSTLHIGISTVISDACITGFIM